MNDRSRPPLLVVEDSDEDFATLQRLLLSQSGRLGPVYRCKDGDEALEFLYRTGNYASLAAAPRPAAILLDLNLPGADGRDVLRQIKGDATLQGIPVVVFTTSDNPADIASCYQSGANGYLIKPLDLTALKGTIEAFVEYWLGVNRPPAPDTIRDATKPD